MDDIHAHNSNSIKFTLQPTWEDKIKWELRMGRNVMVVAHANTLRGLVKLIDNIGDEEIQEVAIPTGADSFWFRSLLICSSMLYLNSFCC